MHFICLHTDNYNPRVIYLLIQIPDFGETYPFCYSSSFLGVVAHNDYGDSGLSNVESVLLPEDSDVSGTFFSFLSSIGILEILTIVGVIVLSQVLISLLISSIVKGGTKGSKGKSKSKKKK